MHRNASGISPRPPGRIVGWIRRMVVGAAAAALLAAVAGTASGSPGQAAATLPLDITFSVTYRGGADCPSGTPADVGCYVFVGDASVRGLGRVTERYVKTVNRDPDNFDATCVRQLPRTVLEVAGKGELVLTRSGPECQKPAPASASYTYTITGGTGAYAGATGEVDVETDVVPSGFAAGRATDRWRGALTVPGLEFDLDAPVVRGAGAKLVSVRGKASRVRVRYAVLALDASDGTRPVTCNPRSGGMFKVGRTTVTCSTEDQSGNTARVRFTVTVRRL